MVFASSTDVFVIGGGPAGLAAAIAARRGGLTVTLADSAIPPIDKACGEGIMPDGIAAARSLGMSLDTAGHPFRGIRFCDASSRVEAEFPHGEALGIRRTDLHQILVHRAEADGVKLQWGARVDGVAASRARWIVGADGANSRVRRWARLERSSRPRLRYWFRRHYRVAPWTDHMEVHWGERCQGYATGVSRQRVCVAMASHDPRMRLEDGLRDLPWLRERLRKAESVSSERGAITGNLRLKRVWRGNVVLIGDAAGTVDAITGEGLQLAFNQAVALAECMETGNLAAYQQVHDRLTLRPRLMARLMLTLDRRPRLQHRTVQVFQQHPDLFRRLLALHVGALPPQQLVRDGLTLGWGLITA